MFIVYLLKAKDRKLWSITIPSSSGLVLSFLHIHKQTDPAGLWDLQHQPPRELRRPRGVPAWCTGAPADPEGEGGHQAVPAGKKTTLCYTFQRSRHATQNMIQTKQINNERTIQIDSKLPLRWKSSDSLRLTLFSFVSVFLKEKGRREALRSAGLQNSSLLFNLDQDYWMHTLRRCIHRL